MIDFSVPPELEELRERTREFVRDAVIPREHDPRQDRHGPSDELRCEMVAEARKAGLLSPHARTEWGGLGLDWRGIAVVLEEAGYSPIGPIALNVQPPDEGNTNLLEQTANSAQKERFLRPLVQGEVLSAFLMTEPDGGAGADPSLMRTTARPDGDGGYVLNGRKWLITGFEGAGFLITMARTEDEAGTDLGASMFLFANGREGVRAVEQLSTMDNNSPGGHSTVDLVDVRVGADEVLGEIGQGFRYAQVRLGPARMTHCMRWLGAARRSHEIAVEHARRRQAFGRRIATDLALLRRVMGARIAMTAAESAAVWVCVFCSEALSRVVDRSLQVLGGKGITDQTVIERIYRDIRSFRIYDGPSEVHRLAISLCVVGRA